MIDYLLCFDDQDEAIEFANTHGFDTHDSHDAAVSIIGEYITMTGPKITEAGPLKGQRPAVGDGLFWVLYRDIKENLEVPEEAETYIVWSSDSGEPRPSDAPDRTFG